MERELDTVLIFCVFLIGSVLSTVASADFNLMWGFEVGNQFHFRKSGTPPTPTIDYYVEIDSIPFNITELDELNISDALGLYTSFYTFYNKDGTEMENKETFLVVPIGNWSYLEEEMGDFGLNVFDTREWINTETEWGFIGTSNYSSTLTTSTVKFSKADGVMTLIKAVAESGDGTTATIQTERREPQANPIIGTEVVVGIGIGIAALVIVGIALRHRRSI